MFFSSEKRRASKTKKKIEFNTKCIFSSSGKWSASQRRKKLFSTIYIEIEFNTKYFFLKNGGLLNEAKKLYQD